MEQPLVETSMWPVRYTFSVDPVLMMNLFLSVGILENDHKTVDIQITSRTHGLIFGLSLDP
jgi:hypothetical protein